MNFLMAVKTVKKMYIQNIATIKPESEVLFRAKVLIIL